MTTLIDAYFAAGLLQFGTFQHSAGERPFQIDLTMLPSYPDLLQITAEQILTLLTEQQLDYWLADAESVPLGVALSLLTEIPLVFSRGGDDAPVFDLVGAYDIGHPTTLLTYSQVDANRTARLIAGARRVGLDVTTLLTVVDAGRAPLDGVTVRSLFTLAGVADRLFEQGKLPAGQREAVRAWLEAADE